MSDIHNIQNGIHLNPSSEFSTVLNIFQFKDLLSF